MQIATVGDALTALQQVNADLTTLQQTITSVSSPWYTAFIPGDTDLASTSTSIVTNLLNYTGKILSEINGQDAGDPLTAQEIAQLKELQQEVIDDRKLINNSISSVNWTFGGIFDDAATILENTASQAVSSVSSSLGINWTAVILVLGGIVVFLVWYKVS